MVKVQRQLAFTHSSTNFHGLFAEMKADISKTVGEKMTEEMDKALGLFISNAESIES